MMHIAQAATVDSNDLLIQKLQFSFVKRLAKAD
jgi:hypothetical protein